MKSAEPGRGFSGGGFSCTTPAGRVGLCGMCPSCVFAPEPPGTAQRPWRASDGVRRRFVVGLLLRCGGGRALDGVRDVLAVASWPLFTYARSTGPTRTRARARAPDGTPPALDADADGIWDWFGASPDWMKCRYLCRIFALCDPELLRMVSNLTSVLLVRQKRGFLQPKCKKAEDASGRGSDRCHQDSDEDSDDPALMVVPGSSKSLSGVSRYRDFIGCLPVYLSKRILGLLEEHTLSHCQKVCRYWRLLAIETVEEIKFRRNFQDQIKAMMKRFKGINTVSPTYSNIVEVLVPTKDDEEADIHSSVQKVKPFEAAYAKIKTKTVRMEERNVYCGAYFTKVLLDKEDPHRVLDYRGGSFMATGSKDRAVRLFHVASETRAVSVMKGHVGSVRAVLLCEDRDLAITGGCDTSIRCWNLKTDRCEMVLYGHTGTVNCLDVHSDRLVSGAKDCTVKGKHCEDFNFKHPSSIQCVKINATKGYSSCDRGLVKIWDMEKASLLRVIDAHRSPVKCLFLDEWHLLSGDSNGQVMAWSINCRAKECLMTFGHPKEVKSLTLVHLRVVTGCVDGKIRIFNFLTGDCLRHIAAEAETGQLLSLRFHDNSILVNTTSSVKLYQFAKVFWDDPESAEGGQGDVLAQGDSVSWRSAAPPRRLPVTPDGADRAAQVASPRRKMRDCGGGKPGRAEPLHQPRFLLTPAKCQTRVRETVKQSVLLSEKATCERMKKRGLHRPLTRDFILLRVGAIKRAQLRDEVSINMEHNARLRDSWGPHTPWDPPHNDTQAPRKSLQAQMSQRQHTPGGHHPRAKTCIPNLRRDAGQNVANTDVTAAPDAPRRHHQSLFSKKAEPPSADTQRAIRWAGLFTTSAIEGPEAHKFMPTRSLPKPECCIKTSAGLPEMNLF